MSLQAVKQRKEWTCPQCARVCDNGWQRLRHTQLGCEVEVGPTLMTQEGSTDENADRGVPLHHGEPQDPDDIDFANAMVDDDYDLVVQDAEKVRADRVPIILKAQHVEDMPQYTQKRARSYEIIEKDMEILLFLQCTDAGNGASQAQKNAMLQYVKGFETPRTRLLPSWIPTCYRRMDKVTLLLVIHNIFVTSFNFTLHPSGCALYYK